MGIYQEIGWITNIPEVLIYKKNLREDYGNHLKLTYYVLISILQSTVKSNFWKTFPNNISLLGVLPFPYSSQITV